jgi:hypothetical protein
MHCRRSEKLQLPFANDPAVEGGRPLRSPSVKFANAVLRGHRRNRTTYARLDVLRYAGAAYGLRMLRDKRKEAEFSQTIRNSVYQHIWEDAAEALGADIVDLGGGLLELRADGAAARVWQQVTGLDDPVTLRLALRKPLVHQILGAEGLAVPEFVSFDRRDLKPANDFLRGSNWGCVIKPASDTGGGDSITCGVTTPDELVRACIRAARRGDQLLIERHVSGEVYRLLLLDGQLIGVVKHGRPRVTGDGSSSIGQLIATENQRRAEAKGLAGLNRLGVDLDCIFTLRRAGLTVHSVPGAAEKVFVKTVTNESSVEDRHTCSTVSSEIVSDAARAARATGLRLAGVDVITPDLTMSLADAGGVINEVNGSPALHHHYLVANPSEAPRVARPVLRRLLFNEGINEADP